MMNPWYETVTSVPPIMQQSSGIQFNNPLQKMQYIMQAMRNPALFVKQHFPDIPDNIINNPNAILDYWRNNMGLTDADIQRVTGGLPNAYR